MLLFLVAVSGCANAEKELMIATAAALKNFVVIFIGRLKYDNEKLLYPYCTK